MTPKIWSSGQSVRTRKMETFTLSSIIGEKDERRRRIDFLLKWLCAALISDACRQLSLDFDEFSNGDTFECFVRVILHSCVAWWTCCREANFTALAASCIIEFEYFNSARLPMSPLNSFLLSHAGFENFKAALHNASPSHLSKGDKKQSSYRFSNNQAHARMPRH